MVERLSRPEASHTRRISVVFQNSLTQIAEVLMILPFERVAG
jgi:hypothetical protein